MPIRTGSEFDFEVCNNRIYPMAAQLVKKYEELRHIDPDKILFVVNHKSKGISKGHRILARMRKLSPIWTELLFQIGSVSNFYMMEFFARNTEHLNESQIIAVIYHELRHIGPDGKLVSHDVQDFWNIIDGLGRHWYAEDASIPNLLDDDVSWNSLLGKAKK